MFKTIGRIIRWCGPFRRSLYIGFVFSFFSTWFAAAPVMIAAYTVGLLLESAQGGRPFDRRLIPLSFAAIAVLIALRFLFDYLRSRFQETISYKLVAQDRLAIGDALKRVSLGYFSQMDTGSILNAITTGLNTLENMGIRMVDTFVGGYLNFLCIFLCLLAISPVTSLIALAGAVVSFLFLLVISRHSAKFAPRATRAEGELTGAALEYIRGLATVKSFGQGGAALSSLSEACAQSRRVNLDIEWGYTPANCLHLLALKTASVALAAAALYLGLAGQMALPLMLMFAFLSFGIFAGLESISDSAHVLSIIDHALNQLEALKSQHYIDLHGRDIAPDHFGIAFEHVRFGYGEGDIIKDVSFTLPEGTTTAIVGPSGSGKTTLCRLIARFYDVSGGCVRVGGHDVREFTCDSLLKNISMVFQNVYLFHDSIRRNICFGRPDASEADMIAAAKRAQCHDFIMSLPDGYDTVIGEGGGTLSGGERQRISIARAMLKNAPIVILDEATASIDPENEHLIQAALSELTRGKTVITIAHRLATIENADQILVVEDGRIAERGTHAELMRHNGLYRRFAEIRRRAEGWKISAN